MPALRLVAIAVALLLGCADEPPAAAPPAPPAALPPVRAFAITGLRLTAVDADQAEDGNGQTVAVVRPVAIDVLASRWTGRALDPVLEVGALRFHHYTYPAPGVLRFVAADGDALPPDAEVAVRWGAERVVVPR